MPKYAEPDIIACPHCEQRFLRHVIMSFDPSWRIAYSDSGVMSVLADAVITESLCTHCQTVIENVSDLTVIDIKSTQHNTTQHVLFGESGL
jgi:hypothetical protein